MEFWSQSTSEIIRNYAIVLGGAAGLVLAVVRTLAASRQAKAQLRQAELARRDHVAELFNRAVGQLKDKKLEVRLGAIFTLQQICDDFPDLAEPILKLLTTHLLQNRVKYTDTKPPADVAAIVEIVSKQRRIGR